MWHVRFFSAEEIMKEYIYNRLIALLTSVVGILSVAILLASVRWPA